MCLSTLFFPLLIHRFVTDDKLTMRRMDPVVEQGGGGASAGVPPNVANMASYAICSEFNFGDS
jgi:hypothetical protein